MMNHKVVMIDITGESPTPSAPATSPSLEHDSAARRTESRPPKRKRDIAFEISSSNPQSPSPKAGRFGQCEKSTSKVLYEQHAHAAAIPPEPEKGSQGVYAVKVGWFPGVYNIKSDARLQVKHYPLAQAERFSSVTTALEWLKQTSESSLEDSRNRPEHWDRVGRKGWTQFLSRTWSTASSGNAISSKDIMRKLRELFLEASRLDEHEIDWSQHPLPSQLLKAEQSTERSVGLSMSCARTRIVDHPVAPVVMCSCQKATLPEDKIVTCSNDQCTVRQYHRRCVGLLNRKPTEHWKCRACRPDPFADVSASLPHVLTPIQPGNAEPQLHPEQQAVVDTIVHGRKNVFYTGSAGTGKSTVLKAFVQQLQLQEQHVDIITPSGISAINVGGTTIYAYAGWHPESFKKPLNQLLKGAHGKTVQKRLCATDVLVIDEISMVESDLFFRLDKLMRKARQSGPGSHDAPKVRRSAHNADMPFGGAQVIVTGDFCQLPPVRPFRFCVFCGGDELPGHSKQDGEPLKCPRCRRTFADEAKWVFASESWASCQFLCFELRQVHRQSDAQFISLLQRCRLGQAFTADQKQLLMARKPDPVGAVKLLPRRMEVERENKRNFDALPNAIYAYECYDCFEHRNKDEPELLKKGLRRYPDRPFGPLLALKDHRFDEVVHLKQGMLVILLVNLNFDAGLVNGAQGCIIGFEPHDPSKVFESMSSAPSSPRSGRMRSRNDERFTKKHEMQGFREGQVKAYVSRARCTEWPIIKFQNGVTQPIYPHCLLSELGSEEPYSLIGRTQLPLIAAWAITIHKSQGMTLNRVIIDLQSSFEKEQVYVALSRARSLEGLKVMSMPNIHFNGLNREVHEFLTSQGLLAIRPADLPKRQSNSTP